MLSVDGWWFNLEYLAINCSHLCATHHDLRFSWVQRHLLMTLWLTVLNFCFCVLLYISYPLSIWEGNGKVAHSSEPPVTIDKILSQIFPPLISIERAFTINPRCHLSSIWCLRASIFLLLLAFVGLMGGLLCAIAMAFKCAASYHGCKRAP